MATATNRKISLSLRRPHHLHASLGHIHSSGGGGHGPHHLHGSLGHIHSSGGGGHVEGGGLHAHHNQQQQCGGSTISSVARPLLPTRLRVWLGPSKKLYFPCIANPESKRRNSHSFTKPFPCFQGTKYSDVKEKCPVRRYSELCEASHDLLTKEDLLSFIKSTFDKHEGPKHCWLNINEDKELFNNNGVFLVLVGAFAEDARLHRRCDHIVMLERVKLLQQRYPKLNIFGFQCGRSVCSVSTQSRIIKTIMEEYITFPVLLSKEVAEMASEGCCLLFKGFESPLFCHGLDSDLEVIVKQIEEFCPSWEDDAVVVQEFSSSRSRQPELIKEPYACSSFRNLLLYYPGCVSVDAQGNRIFVSDTNHHRIIVTDDEGEILDCIGSSPGFQDGEFESAKLLRPAASFYHVGEDCLYIVDSENQAIRRAHIERRVLETVYPAHAKKTRGIWSLILDKLGIGRKDDMEPSEFDQDMFAFPWHLMMCGEDDLIVINRSFEISWILSMATGEIKEIVKGFSNVTEICGQTIMEKVSLLKETLANGLPQRLSPSFSLEELRDAGLMSMLSSIASLHDNIIFCDTAGQRLLKCQRGSRDIINVQFSNFEALGLPYWLVCPLEKVFVSGNQYTGQRKEHIQCFSVLPGRCDIKVTVKIPEGTALAASLQEGCIWRQARGSAAEVYGPGVVNTFTEKVGVAQQWFDELDNLAFSTVDSNIQEEEEDLTANFGDENIVHFGCAVNISPGTSEVVVSAPLYLKLRSADDSLGNEDADGVKKLLDLHGKLGDDACVKLLSETCREAGEFVLLRPLHLRMRFECRDHPTAKTSKEIISTDSTLEVNIFM